MDILPVLQWRRQKKKCVWGGGGQNYVTFLHVLKIIKAHIAHDVVFTAVRKNFERGGANASENFEQ